MAEFHAAKGELVAIPIPWDTASGCVEWRLVDWTLEDDTGLRYPLLDDGSGEDPEAWGDDYAVLDRQTGDWIFPNGERSSDEGLLAAFQRRQARH
jgi:hypothetical protein